MSRCWIATTHRKRRFYNTTVACFAALSCLWTGLPNKRITNRDVAWLLLRQLLCFGSCRRKGLRTSGLTLAGVRFQWCLWSCRWGLWRQVVSVRAHDWESRKRSTIWWVDGLMGWDGLRWVEMGWRVDGLMGSWFDGLMQGPRINMCYFPQIELWF